MEFLRVMHGLCKKDTHVIPKIDNKLATSLQKLSKDPDWTLVQSDKTRQWIPIRIINYITDMEIHLRRYCNEINWLQLDRIYKDTTAIVNKIEDYCSNSEAKFLRSWVETKKIPSVCLSIKDLKPLQPHCLSTQLHTVSEQVSIQINWTHIQTCWHQLWMPCPLKLACSKTQT